MNTIQSNEENLREILTRLESKGKPESRYDEGQEDAMSTILAETPRELLIQSCLQPNDYRQAPRFLQYYSTSSNTWSSTPFGEYNPQDTITVYGEAQAESATIKIYAEPSEDLDSRLKISLLFDVIVGVDTGYEGASHTYHREQSFTPTSKKYFLMNIPIEGGTYMTHTINIRGIRFDLQEG